MKRKRQIKKTAIKKGIRELHKIHHHDFLLTKNNRLTYVYKINQKGVICEVTTVSLEILVKKKWKTIVYYDSSHDGRLHRHTYMTFENNSDIVDNDRIRKKSSQKGLLQWAVTEVKRNYLSYKRKFITRYNKLQPEVDIELY